ncbi:MAG: hypothetical protein MUC50_21740 [Myxococcota bacterium]|jgi:hypothetical protein|nr:hypothetical protein [Myxococcota bacterium]
MQHVSNALVLSLLAGAVLAGCYEATDDKQTDSDSQSTHDTDTRSDSQSVSDSDTSGETVEQPPITFRVTNTTGQMIYIDYLGALSFAQKSSSETWESARFFEPGCKLECSEVDPSPGSCCIECAPMEPAVWAIDPDASHDFAWDGDLRQLLTEPCGGQCDCHVSVNPTRGAYRVSVTAGNDVMCDPGDCLPPDDQGVIWGAMRTAAALPVDVEFVLPTDSSVIQLNVVKEN